MKDVGRSLDVIEGVGLEIDELYPNTNSLRIRLWSNGTTEFESFQFEFACLYPPLHFKDDDYEIITIHPSAKLFKVTVKYDPADETDPKKFWLVARFYFWASDCYQPLIIAECYLLSINLLAFTTTGPTPEGVALA